MTIGIGSLKLEPAIHCVCRCQSDAVIVRVARVLRLGNHSKSRIGLGNRQSSKWSAGGTESIQGWIRDLFMLAMIAHIFRAHCGVPTQSLLYFKVPLVITRNLHFARVKEIEGRNRSAVGKISPECGIGRSRLPIQAPLGPKRKSTVKSTNDGSFGAFVKMSSIPPVGIASLKMPIPPRITVFLAPNGDHAKPTLGSYTIEVTEGNAVFNPVRNA